MSRTVRCTSAVRGSMNVNVSLSALAIMIERSSGVRYRWCGSLPVGILRISSHVTGLITLTLASNEFRTNNGVVCDANAELESATKAQKKKRNRDERKEPTNDLLMNEIVALIPTKASISLESPNRANALSPATSTHRVLRTRVIPMRQFVSGGAAPPCYPRQPTCV